MSTTRTWILSIALALGLSNLAQAQPGPGAALPTSYGTAAFSANSNTTYSGGNGAFGNAGAFANGGCGNGACGNGCPNQGICPRHGCPHPEKHCAVGPPRIHFKRGCPAPVCPPCDAPNWGYFQTCWTPWPWSPDWSHCPVIPPAATVVPGPRVDATAVAPVTFLPEVMFPVQPALPPAHRLVPSGL